MNYYNTSTISLFIPTEKKQQKCEEDEATKRKIYKFLKKETEIAAISRVQLAGRQAETSRKEVDGEEIRYDRMRGRPSIVIKIQGIRIDCLIDTGAIINVMNYDFFKRL